MESIGTCLQKLCTIHLKIRSGREDCCKIQECAELDTRVDKILFTLRKENRETENGQIISGFLDWIVFILDKYRSILTTMIHSEIYKDEDEQPILTDIDKVLSFYLTYGCHDTDLFYEKIRTYDSLKSRPLKVCCVCGIREMLGENESKLQDALPFKYLLAVNKEELANFLALKEDDDDWCGVLAQECYHIELV